MLQNYKLCGLCKNIHCYQSDSNFVCSNLNNIPLPVYSETFLNEINSKLLANNNCCTNNNKSKFKYYLGIIKFKHKQ